MPKFWKFSLIIAFILSVLGGMKPVMASHSPGVRAHSLGEAYRAVATGSDIVFYNPAGLLKSRRIGADMDYLLASESRLNSLSVSVVDSKTTSWGLGLGYNAGINTLSDIKTTHLAHLAFAMPLMSELFFLGANFSYLYDETDLSEAHKHFFNIDLGIFAQLEGGLSFAIVADHLLTKKGREKSLGLSLAGAFELGDIFARVPFTASFDWTMQDVKSADDLDHILGTGLQYVAFEMLPLRLGYEALIKSQDHLLSLGSGLILANVALDALYQQHLMVGKTRYFGLALRLIY